MVELLAVLVELLALAGRFMTVPLALPTLPALPFIGDPLPALPERVPAALTLPASGEPLPALPALPLPFAVPAMVTTKNATVRLLTECTMRLHNQTRSKWRRIIGIQFYNNVSR